MSSPSDEHGFYFGKWPINVCTKYSLFWFLVEPWNKTQNVRKRIGPSACTLILPYNKICNIERKSFWYQFEWPIFLNDPFFPNTFIKKNLRVFYLFKADQSLSFKLSKLSAKLSAISRNEIFQSSLLPRFSFAGWM